MQDRYCLLIIDDAITFVMSLGCKSLVHNYHTDAGTSRGERKVKFVGVISLLLYDPPDRFRRMHFTCR